MKARISTLALLSAFSLQVSAMDISFSNVAERANLFYTGLTFGQSWGDFNRDGYADLYVSNHGKQTTIYQNNGGLNFSSINSQVNADLTGDIHAGAWADFDNDGDRDLLFLEGASGQILVGPNRFLVNNDGIFDDEASSWGLEQELARARTPSWFDWNNDGLLDVALSNWPRADGQDPSAVFTRVGTGFSYENDNAGYHPVFSNNFAVLVKTNTQPEAVLLVNTVFGFPEGMFEMSQLPFTDLSQSLGVPSIGATWDFTAADFDGDLDQEIYFTRQYEASEVVQVNDKRLHISINGLSSSELSTSFDTAGPITLNVGPKFAVSLGSIHIGSSGYLPTEHVFTLDSSDPAVWDTPAHNTSLNAMYVYFDTASSHWRIDITHKLRPRIIADSPDTITNIETLGFTPSTGARVPVLLKQTVNGYQDIATQSNLTTNLPCQSVAAADFDNDMDVDIFLACKSAAVNLSNVLLENDGTGHFSEVANAAGASGTALGRSDTAAIADYNNDGFMDILVTNGAGAKPLAEGPTELFENSGNSNHWIHINLEGVTVNRDGVGAWVIVKAGDVLQSRLQDNGSKRFGQDDQRLHFGLGSNELIQEIRVRWPGGVQQVLKNVTVDRVITIPERNRDNDVPAISGTPPTVVAQGDAYNFLPATSDPDGDTLLFSINNKPSWMTFDTATGDLTGTPGNNDVGITTNIVITADDQQELPNSVVSLAPFNLEVSNINDAPVLNPPIGSRSTMPGSFFGPLDLSSHFSDPDGDALTYSISGLPAGSGISISAAGIVSGTLTDSDTAASPISVSVTATDPFQASSSDTFTLLVTFEDSNGDGISDEQAIQLGLDPTDPDGDTDNDGIPDSVEIGNPDAPLDQDGDGRLDALEPGNSASDASVISALPLANGDTVSISTATGESLSRVIVSEITGAPTGIAFPFGIISYTTTSPIGGSVTVRLSFSSDLPANLVIYKLDNAGIFTELPASLWMKIDERTIDITLTDGDPVTDLDGVANGSIDDPIALGDGGDVAPVPVNTGGGSGGGGCTTDTHAEKDPVFPLLLLFVLIHLLRKYRRQGKNLG